jgi:hypothetical protein
MAGLIFLVVGVRQEHRRQAIESHHAIGLRVFDRFRIPAAGFSCSWSGASSRRVHGSLAAEHVDVDAECISAEQEDVAEAMLA